MELTRLTLSLCEICSLESYTNPYVHINSSIENSNFIAKWKIGRLLPLYKGKGLDIHSPDSYRPISLLPVLSKLTEHALKSQILKFMRDTNQLNENHHSYQAGHSTTTAMLQLCDQIFEGCNNNQITAAITLDSQQHSTA